MRNLKLLIFTILISTCSVLLAQQYSFRNIGVKEGLLHNQINCIFQDSLGYIWFGTEAGAAKFDGDKIFNYTKHDGLVSNQITFIDQFEHNELIIGTKKGISIIKNNKISNYPLKSRSANAIAYHKGLNQKITGTQKGLYVLTEDTIKPIKTHSELDSISIRNLLYDKNGKLWIGTQFNGIYIATYKSGKLHFTKLNSPSGFKINKIRDIKEDHLGKIWIATAGSGVFTYFNNKFERFTLNGKFKYNYISSIAFCNESVYFSSWGDGVLKITEEEIISYNKTNGLQDYVSMSVFCDNEKNMWIGTLSFGVKMELKNLFKNYSKKEGLCGENIRDIYNDSQDNLWITTLEGVSKFKNNTIQNFTKKNGLSFNRVGPIEELENNEIVIGGYDGSLNFIKPDGSITFKRSSKVAMSEFLSLRYTYEKRLIIGTYSNGLLEYKNDKFISLGLPDRTIWCIQEDNNLDLWIGTDDGLFILSEGRFELFSPQNENISQDKILDIKIKDDYIFIATASNGVWKYSKTKKTFQYLSKKIGLSSDQIQSIIWSDDSTLFLGTLRGLDRISFSDSSFHITSYSESPNLFEFKFNPNAIEINKNGLWLGANGKLINYNLTPNTKDNVLPKLYVSEVNLFYGSVDIFPYIKQHDPKLFMPKKISLPYNQNHLQFHYTGILFKHFGDLEYQYWLEGFDQKWSPHTKNNDIVYSNLPPGDYNFKVRCTIDGVNYVESKNIAIHISKPYWASYWFYILISAMIIAIIVLIHFRNKAQRTNLKQKIDEKTIELRQSEEKYKGIIESSVDIIYQTNFKGDFIYINLNKHLEDKYGYTTKEILAMNFKDLVRNDYVETISAFYTKNWKNPDIVNNYMEFPIICKDGTEKWMGQKVNLIFEDEAKTRIKFFQSICRDITDKKIVEEELEKLSLVASKTNSYVIILDADHRIEWVNETFIELTGYTLEDSKGKNAGELLKTAFNTTDTHLDILNTTSKGNTYNGEVLNFSKDGNPIWVMLNLTPIIRDGIITKHIAIGSNITEIKIANDKIAKSEQRFRELVEQTSDLVQSVNENGYFEYTNPAWQNMLEYTQEEAKKLLLIDVLDNSMTDKINLLFDQLLAQPEKIFETELTFISKTGKKVYLEGNVIASKRETGTLIRAIFHNITERKILLENITKSEENFRLLAESMSEVFWLTEANTSKTIYVNQAYEKLYETSKNTLLENSRSWIEYIITDEFKKVVDSYSQISFKQNFNEKYRIVTPNGKIKWVHTKAIPIRDENDKITKIAGISRDITEQKENEERMKKLKDYFEFLHYIGSTLIKENDHFSLIKTVLTDIKELFNNVLKSSFIEFDLSIDAGVRFEMDFSNNEIKTKRTKLKISSLSSYENIKEGKEFYEPNLIGRKTFSETDQGNINDGIKSYIILPLSNEKESFGAIAVGFNKINPLEDIEVTMLNELSSLISTIILKNRLVEEVKYHNQEIMSSLDYAQTIQKTILPNQKEFDNFFEDHFIVYLPKEKVSGDFYWFRHAKDNKNKAIFGVIDCTGHGVPGAFVSMVGSKHLSTSVLIDNLVDPGKILEQLNKEVIQTMKGNEMTENDGMDISLCSYDKKTKKLVFSGAINSLILIRNGELIEYSGGFWSIGQYMNNSFKSIEIDILPKDIIYMATDGFEDQFGGEFNKRIMKKRVKKLLLENSDLPMNEQKSALINYLNDWKGDEDQIDDITIMGIKF